MKKTVFVLCLAASLSVLTNCSGVSFNAGILPDVQEYSKAQQKQAAAELRKYGALMPIVGGLMIPDYGVMRKQVRATKKILP